jgi:peptidyl-prolyl cis-trans isomerase B (cyclophilin B)
MRGWKAASLRRHLCFGRRRAVHLMMKGNGDMADVTEKTRATISITSKGQRIGDIVLRFFHDVAPGHVKNFIDLAKKGFYNGTTFHRVIPKFMIQGGDPNSKNPDRSSHGMGGPGYKVKAEFNSKPHKRGVLSMARANDPDSAGSQFFICVADSHFLDWQYTAFGEVVSGMEAADAVVAMKRDGRDNPLERVEMTVTITD